MDGEAMADAEGYTLGEVIRAVKRIEDKLDNQVRDHEARIRSLEQWMWRLAGASAAGVVGSVAAWIQIITKGKV